jgi:hypothetical protein
LLAALATLRTAIQAAKSRSFIQRPAWASKRFATARRRRFPRSCASPWGQALGAGHRARIPGLVGQVFAEVAAFVGHQHHVVFGGLGEQRHVGLGAAALVVVEGPGFFRDQLHAKALGRAAQGGGVGLIVLGLADDQQRPLPFAQHQELRQGIGQHGPARQAVQHIAQALGAAQAVVGAAGVEQQAVGQAALSARRLAAGAFTTNRRRPWSCWAWAAASRASGLSTVALVRL